MVATLGAEELEALYEQVLRSVPSTMLGALTLANRTGELSVLLELLRLGHLLDLPEQFETHKTGKVLLIGEFHIDRQTIESLARGCGIAVNRLELVASYGDAKTYKYSKLRHNAGYAAVLVSAMPHRTVDGGDFSSVITMMESKRHEYPPVVRLNSSGELKATKSSVREAFQRIVRDGVVTPN